MKETDEYYFRSQHSGAIVGNITGLTIWYELICPECGIINKTGMSLGMNNLRPKTRKDLIKCKKCKKTNSFETYFGIKIDD